MKKINSLTKQLQLKKRLGLVTHVVIGYPTLTNTYELIACMVDAGVDAIELQIPFSDPLADGSTIMSASQTALANGTTPQQCLEFCERVCADFKITFIIMTYYNIVHQFGPHAFVRAVLRAGVSGLIIPDIPLTTQEGIVLHNYASSVGVTLISVVAPHTTSQRLELLKPMLQDLIYLPQVQGVTGARDTVEDSLGTEVLHLRKYTDAAIIVGFGIASVNQMCAVKQSGADLAVIGSSVLDRYNKGGLFAVKEFLMDIRNAT